MAVRDFAHAVRPGGVDRVQRVRGAVLWGSVERGALPTLPATRSHHLPARRPSLAPSICTAIFVLPAAAAVAPLSSSSRFRRASRN